MYKAFNKLISATLLLAFLISNPALSASYGKPYQANNTEVIYYSNSVNQEEELPSERSLAEMESQFSITQTIVLLGEAEDPFETGAGTDDPNAYNDAPVGDGINTTLLMAFCYAMLKWVRARRSKTNDKGNKQTI